LDFKPIIHGQSLTFESINLFDNIIYKLYKPDIVTHFKRINEIMVGFQTDYSWTISYL